MELRLAYISGQLNNKGALLDLNQRYGAIAPDLFYFSSLSLDRQNELSAATHCDNNGGFMRVWNAAPGTTITKKALAFGFVSHNNAWGADFYAHPVNCPDLTPIVGNSYIVNMANQLAPLLYSNPATKDDFLIISLAIYNAQLDFDLGAELTQDVVEAAVDILLKNKDAHIGEKVVTSSILRSPEFPSLLIKAYAAYFHNKGYFTSDARAALAITSAEFSFRTAMTLYGSALQQDPATATQLISDGLVIRFAGILQAYRISVPFNVLQALTKAALEEALILCEPTYEQALSDTIKGLRNEMKPFSY